MILNSRLVFRGALVIGLILVITFAAGRLRADTGTCGGANITLPFTDVASGNVFFCSIAEAFLSGLSNGTDATHYSPAANVPREQMAAFVTRTMDQSLKRGSRRAVLDQYWTPTSADGLGFTTVGNGPGSVKCVGSDLWTASLNGNSVSRVHGSNGKLLGTWTGATGAAGILAAKGLIFATGNTTPGKLYQIDPTAAVGAVTTLSSTLGATPQGISFDGTRIWTANAGNGFSGGSVSIVTLNPLTVNTVTTGFGSLKGILYDGANMWVTDFTANKLFKLDAAGAIIQTVTTGHGPDFPVFDGTNIWVPNFNSTPPSVTVVRASTAVLVATLNDNDLNNPESAAFDCERVLVTNGIVNLVSLWKASDLSPIGSVYLGQFTDPVAACSDGLNFWIALAQGGSIARF